MLNILYIASITIPKLSAKQLLHPNNRDIRNWFTVGDFQKKVVLNNLQNVQQFFFIKNGAQSTNFGQIQRVRKLDKYYRFYDVYEESGTL